MTLWHQLNLDELVNEKSGLLLIHWFAWGSKWRPTQFFQVSSSFVERKERHRKIDIGETWGSDFFQLNTNLQLPGRIGWFETWQSKDLVKWDDRDVPSFQPWGILEALCLQALGKWVLVEALDSWQAGLRYKLPQILCVVFPRVFLAGPVRTFEARGEARNSLLLEADIFGVFGGKWKILTEENDERPNALCCACG